ncbi:tetratricopeptide repeat protein [Candidatus Acetothermia bacterium]|nr:tetratricopeptide repeat protein [Candidatus Acetothermia bacterium]
MSTLRVSLFGGFHAERDDFAIKNFHSQKTQLLLAYLMVYRQRAHPREVLANLFWEDTPERAAANLRAALHALRQLIEGSRGQFGSYVLSEGGALRFNTQSAYWLDIEAFEHAVAASQKASGEEKVVRLREAVELYQGDLLAGFYEDWVLIEQQHFRDLYLQALKELIAYHQERREYEQAIAWARRALETSALQEEFHQILIQLYTQSGNRAAALKQYVECEAILKRELHLKPSPELRELYEKTLRGAVPDGKKDAVTPSPGSPLRHSLPRSISSFVGRKREVSELKQLLSKTDLLTVTGIGGCGKTRLALSVATALAPEYADGIGWIELAALTEAELIPQAIASVLGLREERNRPLLATLSEYLKSRELLLILDNCEHLIAGCARVVDALLRSCPHMQILATSREALGITGETVWKTPPLFVPHLENLPSRQEELVSTVSKYEAIELFVTRVTECVPEFAITAQNALTIVEICHRLDGIPLALELAAARARALSLEEILGRLNDALGLLTQGNRTAPHHHQTLRAALDWSFRLLSEQEQLLFRRLSVFAGGFTLEMVEGSCSEPPLSALEALDLLTHLINKSLVSVSYREGKVRYHLLDTVRQYAAENLESCGEASAMRKRHGEFFSHLAESSRTALRGPHQVAWLDRLETNHDNLRAALTWNLVHNPKIGLRMAHGLQHFWSVRGHLSEGRRWIEASLVVEDFFPVDRAEALNRAGIMASEQGDYKQAITRYEESLALWRQLGDKRGIVTTLNNLGGIAWARGDFPRARALFEESLALKRKLGDDKFAVASSLNNLGLIAQTLGEYAKAQTLHAESLAIRQELGDKRGMASSFVNLGSIAQAQGDYPTAHSQLERSLALHREIGDRQGTALSLYTLGNLTQITGDYTAARSYHQESLDIRQEVGDKRGISYSLSSLGGIAQIQGDNSTARSLYEKGLAIQHELGDKQGIAYSLFNLGSIAQTQEDYTTASALHEESLAIKRALGDKRGTANSLSNLGVIAQAQGDDSKAYSLFAESLKMKIGLGDRQGILESLLNLATLAETQKSYERAACLFGAAGALRELIRAALSPGNQASFDRSLNTTRDGLGTEAFGKVWAKGRAMTLEEAIEYALSTPKKITPDAP